MPTAPAKIALLGMLGGRAPDPALAAADWATIAGLADAHRLGPLLAWRAAHGGWAAPPRIAQGWATASRGAALAALAQQAALRLILPRLQAAGIAAVALKGVRLAWRDYPAPALRPMRDIDVLVPEAEIRAAAQVLAAAGFAASTDDPAAIAEALARDRHLPPFEHRGLGVTVELHHRLSDPPGRRGYVVPQLEPAAAIAGAEILDLGGTRVPCPATGDLLAHLVTHALYSHRLDCGPLILADIHFLAADPALDWAGFRSLAARGGWTRGADLLLALTARWLGPVPAAVDAPPDAVLSMAEEAILADPAGGGQAELFADLAAARSPAALGAMLRRRLAPDRQIAATEGKGRPGWQFWPVWALRRIAGLVRRLLDRDARREAREAAGVMRWLQG